MPLSFPALAGLCAPLPGIAISSPALELDPQDRQISYVVLSLHKLYQEFNEYRHQYPRKVPNEHGSRVRFSERLLNCLIDRFQNGLPIANRTTQNRAYSKNLRLVCRTLSADTLKATPTDSLGYDSLQEKSNH